jgi:hypothetical protein
MARQPGTGRNGIANLNYGFVGWAKSSDRDNRVGITRHDLADVGPTRRRDATLRTATGGPAVVSQFEF